MAWETRRNGRYYYNKVWRAGTCQSEYVGTGLIADLSAHDRAQAAFERDEWRALVDGERALDQEIDGVLATIRTLRDAVLIASGYHRHKGQWRKRRAPS
jgi:hypothetical protein